jgi:hypothetical protein
MALAAAAAQRRDAQVGRIQELQVLERRVGAAIDRVVGELVDAGQRQLVEPRVRIGRLERAVADLRRRRHVAGVLVDARRIAAVAGRAREPVGARERMRVLEARTGVVVVLRTVVAEHARSARELVALPASAVDAGAEQQA